MPARCICWLARTAPGGAYRADQGSFFQNGEQVEIDGPTAEPDAAATGKLTARFAFKDAEP